MKLKLPKGREHLWPCYRLILEGKATWTEVTTMMSIDHVFDLNEMLTAYQKAKIGD